MYCQWYRHNAVHLLKGEALPNVTVEHEMLSASFEAEMKLKEDRVARFWRACDRVTIKNDALAIVS